jgi:hypothetical protein
MKLIKLKKELGYTFYCTDNIKENDILTIGQGLYGWIYKSEFEEFLKTYGGKIYLRRLKCESEEQYHKIFNIDMLRKIHQVVYDKPYDTVVADWIEAYCQKDNKPQKTSRFWCSALIGYIYTKLTLLRSDLDWSILTPSFFSNENKTFSMLHGAMLEKEEQIWG